MRRRRCRGRRRRGRRHSGRGCLLVVSRILLLRYPFFFVGVARRGVTIAVAMVATAGAVAVFMTVGLIIHTVAAILCTCRGATRAGARLVEDKRGRRGTRRGRANVPVASCCWMMRFRRGKDGGAGVGAVGGWLGGGGPKHRERGKSLSATRMRRARAHTRESTTPIPPVCKGRKTMHGRGESIRPGMRIHRWKDVWEGRCLLGGSPIEQPHAQRCRAQCGRRAF